MTVRSEQPRGQVGLLAALLAPLFVAALARHAAAQDLLPEKSVSVRERPRPEYSAPGLAWGSFRLRPELTVGAAYNDNVFATEEDPVGDRITTLASELTAQSQGTRLPISLYAGVESVSYDENPLEDYFDWAGGASTEYALLRGTRVALNADVAHQHESRSDPSFPSTAVEPPELRTSALALQMSHDFASGSLELAFNRESLAFDDALLADGTLADQDFRDRHVDGYQLQGNVVLGPSAAVFVRAVHQKRDYALQPGASGLNRDSKTDGLYAGAVLDLTNLMRGELGIGVLDLDNADPSQADRRSTALTSSVEVFLTQLMTATVTLGRSSAAADLAGIASYIGTNASFRLDYEVRRNVILSARLNRSLREYSDVDEEDTVNLAAVSAQWLLNRHARLEFDYTTTDQEWGVAAVGKAYEDEVISLSVSFAL
jgi:hypothetical protein